MKILYVTYIDMDKSFSGSTVRPKKLLDAFLASGYNVELLSGAFTKNDHNKRRREVEAVIQRIEAGEKFDLCYIESISGLLYKFYNKYEYKLWHALKKVGIPTGIFYRDIYWKFPKLFPAGSRKGRLQYFLCRLELNKICKLMDVVFVPSKEMAEYMPKGVRYIALPSGCENYELQTVKNEIPAFIYVGGTSYNYGTDIMLEAFESINKRKKIVLNLICRKDETKLIDEFLKTRGGKPEWLNIIHASGKELQKYYFQSDYAVYPLRRNVYYDFAVAVKLFEYISFEKPILCTDCKVISKIVSQNGLGKVKNCDVKSFADGISEMVEEGAEKYHKNIITFKNNNTWGKRVDLIVDSLLRNGEK